MTFFFPRQAALYAVSPSETDKQYDLSSILQNTAAYCEKLMNQSLHFICEEHIKERSHRVSTYVFLSYRTAPTVNKYVYDYQLIRKNGRISESRTLIEENGKKKKEKNAPLKTHFFTHRYVVFGPVGLLSKKAQSKHQYQIDKETTWKGHKVIIIKASPRPEISNEGLFGKVWVNKKDHTVLKIEWNQQSMGNYQKIVETAEHFKAEPRITFTSEYEFEKNGIRFPSKYSVKEEYIRHRGGNILSSLTTVEYKNYKFFVVETDVRFRR